MQTHKVKPKETLAKIANQVYGDPDKYTIIAQANKITDPNKIRVGQVLKIPSDETGTSDSTDLMTIQQPAVPVDRATMRLPRGQYIEEQHSKNLIVLHFTAGTSARSAFNTWTADPQRIATAYIVDRDGTIYELFDPGCWAFALGIKGQPDRRNEKRSIQIEIANVGPLKKKDETLCWWPPSNSFNTRFCHMDESHKYVMAPFRGFDYYAAFPDIQFFSLCSLVKTLCRKFDIPPQIPEGKLEECNLKYFSRYEGIASHQNFREDKFDIGPAFNWNRFQELLM